MTLTTVELWSTSRPPTQRRLHFQLPEGAAGDAAAAASADTSSSTAALLSAGLSVTAGGAELWSMKSDMMSRNRPQNRSGMVTAVR